MPRAPAALDTVPIGLAEDAERRVREAGAVLVTRLTGNVKLTRGAQTRLLESLSQRGLERTARFVRVPLIEQLATALASGEVVAVPSLRKRLAGTTGLPDVRQAIAECSRTGAIRLVTRDGKPHVVASSADLITDAELTQLETMASDLGKMLRLIRPKRGQPRVTLFRDDVARVLSRFEATSIAIDPVRAIVDAVGRSVRDGSGLAFLPDVARDAAVKFTAEVFRESVLAAGSARHIELRPESGLTRLSEQDASWCPRAPNGAILSYARRLGG